MASIFTIVSVGSKGNVLTPADQIAKAVEAALGASMSSASPSPINLTAPGQAAPAAPLAPKEQGWLESAWSWCKDNVGTIISVGKKVAALL